MGNDVFRNRPPYGETANGADVTIYAGQPWIMFSNLGSSDATVEFWNTTKGVKTFTATIPGGLSLNLGNRVDGNAWDKFIIKPGSSTVQAIFEKQNLT